MRNKDPFTYKCFRIKWLQDCFQEGSVCIPQGYSGKACCKGKKWIIAGKTKSHQFLLEPEAASVCSGLLTMAWQKLAGTRDQGEQRGEWNLFPMELVYSWLNSTESSAVVPGVQWEQITE